MHRELFSFRDTHNKLCILVFRLALLWWIQLVLVTVRSVQLASLLDFPCSFDFLLFLLKWTGEKQMSIHVSTVRRKKKIMKKFTKAAQGFVQGLHKKNIAIAAYAPLTIHMRLRWCHSHGSIWERVMEWENSNQSSDSPRKLHNLIYPNIRLNRVTKMNDEIVFWGYVLNRTRYDKFCQLSSNVSKCQWIVLSRNSLRFSCVSPAPTVFSNMPRDIPHCSCLKPFSGEF